MNSSKVGLSSKFVQAVAYAARLHGDQVRKGNGAPYISHLLGVSSLVLESGGDEEQAIAGLLHDAVEDHGGPPRFHEIEEQFGSRVGQIVLACSEIPRTEQGPDAFWSRKLEYLDRLGTMDEDALLVAIADKVHNARAMATYLQVDGVAVLSKFTTTPQQLILYYLEALRVAVERGVSQSLTNPLRHAVSIIQAEIVNSTAPGSVLPLAQGLAP